MVSELSVGKSDFRCSHDKIVFPLNSTEADILIMDCMGHEGVNYILFSFLDSHEIIPLLEYRKISKHDITYICCACKFQLTHCHY